MKQEKEDSAGDIAASAAQPSHHESAAQAESVLVDTPVKSNDPSTPPPQRVLTRNRLKKGAGKVQLTPMTDAVNKIGKSNMRTKPPKGRKFPGATIALPSHIVTDKKSKPTGDEGTNSTPNNNTERLSLKHPDGKSTAPKGEQTL